MPLLTECCASRRTSHRHVYPSPTRPMSTHHLLLPMPTYSYPSPTHSYPSPTHYTYPCLPMPTYYTHPCLPLCVWVCPYVRACLLSPVCVCVLACPLCVRLLVPCMCMCTLAPCMCMCVIVLCPTYMCIYFGDLFDRYLVFKLKL